jgi:hypothetical protein
MAKRLLAYIVIFLVCEAAHSQILVSRNFEVNPLRADMEKERRVLGNTFFGAEMGHGFFSAEQEQTWNIKLHGFIEFYRWGNRASIGLSLAHELHANPYNEIYFNPRGAVWNESLVYHRRLQGSILQLGANHRCRHNIDNADPPRQDVPRFDYEPQSRVLVLTSLFAGFLADPTTIAPGWEFDYFGRGDFYLYREDARRPRQNQEGSWESIWGSAMGGFSLRRQLNEHWQLYTRNHLNYVLFEGHPNQINYRAETGISLLGEKAGISLFAAYERFFDDTSRPFPLTSNVLSVGIRGMGLDFF